MIKYRLIRYASQPEDSWMEHLDEWYDKRVIMFPGVHNTYEIDYDKVHEMTEEEYMVMKLKYGDLFWFMEIVK